MSAHSNDRNAERLLQLSDEVSRIAGTLAQLSTRAEPAADLPVFAEVSADHVMKIIRARRLRDRFFDSEIFGEPAWDMILNLFHAELMQRRVTVSSLTAASDVPATTALRWIKLLVTNGLFVRREDPFDGRRVFVELSPEASTAIRRYFGEAGQFLSA